MTVKELKELLERFDEEKELIFFAECDVEGSKFKGAIQHDYLSVAMNGDCVQLFMQ